MVIEWRDPETSYPLAGVYDPSAEAVAFVVGDRPAADRCRVRGIWPTANQFEERPGGRGRDLGYAIGAEVWREARAEAASRGGEVLGHLHTHLYGSAAPSFLDHRTVKAHMLGAVWHPRTLRLVWFTGGRVVMVDQFGEARVLAALARLTCAAGEPLAEPDPADWPPAINRWDLPDDPVAIEAARIILAAVDDPATDPDAVRAAPERVEALRAALRGAE